jgi:hypothetical protein
MEEVEYNILKCLLFEFLDMAPAIIFMTLFCKVNNRSLLNKFPPNIIPHLLQKWKQVK